MKNPDEFQQAFAKAWFKLIHRDLGPKSRYLGNDYTDEEFLWQDPLPQRDFDPIDEEDAKKLKKMLLESIAKEDLIYTAWSAAATFRKSDFRGGINGVRIRLEPQKNWEVNEPERLSKVLEAIEAIQKEFNATSNRHASIADLVVLGGNAAIEAAIEAAGYSYEVPFHPGRVDATQEQTDIRSFEFLRPVADGFRNYKAPECKIPAELMLLDRAQFLGLSAPEMTVLIGGLRVLGANYKKSDLGIFTDRPGVLSNDFFVNLLDMSVHWEMSEEDENLFYGYDRSSGELRWRATRVDLIFGAHSELRAQSEFYAQDDNKEKFIKDFVKAWVKVMELDRFELS